MLIDQHAVGFQHTAAFAQQQQRLPQVFDDFEQGQGVERLTRKLLFLQQTLMHPDPCRLGRSGDVRRGFHAFRLETELCRRHHEVAARAADVDQAHILRRLPEQSCDPIEAAARDLEPPLKFAPGGLVEIGAVELRHSLPVARGADLAHQLAAAGAAQQRALRQHDVGGNERRRASHGAGGDVGFLQVRHARLLL